MALVDVALWLPTGGPTAQVRRLGPKVGSRLALFCIYRANRMNSRTDTESCIVVPHVHCENKVR